MKKIYLLVSYSGSHPAKIVRRFSGEPYSHVSLALNPQLSPLYSFGRRRINNPLIGGFITEEIGKGIFEKFPHTVGEILEWEVEDRTFETIQTELNGYLQCPKRYRYSFLAAGLSHFGLEYRPKYRSYCSAFVRNLLEGAGADLSAIPKLCTPCDFEALPGVRCIYRGEVNRYQA